MIYYRIFLLIIAGYGNHENVPLRFSICKECSWIQLHFLSSDIYFSIHTENILLMGFPSQ